MSLSAVYTAAKGTLASSSITNTKSRAGQAAAQATTAPKSGTRAPRAAAAKPRLKARDTAQSVSRFAMGEISETYPNTAATMGVVNTTAPSEEDTDAMTAERVRRSFIPLRLNRRDSRRSSAGDTVTMPSIEANESCRLTDSILIGLAARSNSSDADRPVSPSDSRPSSVAPMLMRSITQALTMALEQPAMSVNSIISGAPAAAARRLPSRAHRAEYRKDRCMPDTDMTCAVPVRLRALSRA